MPLNVSSACPECGAPTKHNEGALTFQCQFCASVLRMPDDGRPLKYIIPSRLGNEQAAKAVKKALVDGKIKDVSTVKKISVVYKPFWQIKGMLFFLSVSGGRTSTTENSPFGTAVTVVTTMTTNVGSSEISAKTWFHSIPANDVFLRSFVSLGIQSEIMELEHFDSEKLAGAEVLPVTVEQSAALETAKKTALVVMNDKGTMFPFSDLKMIGTKLSLIYYPVVMVVCQGKSGFQTIKLDGVNGNYLGEEAGTNSPEPAGASEGSVHVPKLLTHRCPNCGHNLKTGDFDITFHCVECRSLWLLKGNEYVRMKINALSPPSTGKPLFIPFWRYALEITGGDENKPIRKIGELAEIMKGRGFSLRNEDPEREIAFYVPALVSRNATGFLNFAMRINTFQKVIPLYEGDGMPDGELFGASLSDEEARKFLEPLVFAVTGRVDHKMIEFYHNIKITVKNSELVLYPIQAAKDAYFDPLFDFHFPKRWLDPNVY